MEGYLGNFPVDIATSEFANYTAADWAMLYIEKYGQIDGAHHKAWVLDQVARILKGTYVVVTEARWENGHTEFRFKLGEPSNEYGIWVDEMVGDWDEEYETFEYSYEVGIAP